MVIMSKKKYEDMRKEIAESFELQEKEIKEIKKDYEKKIKDLEKKYNGKVEKLENAVKELAASIGNYNSSKAFNEIMDEYLNGKKKD